MKNDIKNGARNTRRWAAALAGIFCIACALAILTAKGGAAGRVARIYQQGRLIEEIDLSRVSAAYEFTLRSEAGENSVMVKKGAICISAADCADQTCVRQGWLTGGLAPIVCLPHEIIIRLESPDSDAEFDAVAG